MARILATATGKWCSPPSLVPHFWRLYRPPITLLRTGGNFRCHAILRSHFELALPPHWACASADARQGLFLEFFYVFDGWLGSVFRPGILFF